MKIRTSGAGALSAEQRVNVREASAWLAALTAAVCWRSQQVAGLASLHRSHLGAPALKRTCQHCRRVCSTHCCP